MRLRTKLLFFSVPLYLVAVVVMTLLVRFGAQTIVKQGVYNRGVSVATTVNAEALTGFRFKDEQYLLPYLQAMQENTQALYAIALDPSGRVLAHTNVAETGKLYQDAVTIAAIGSEETLSHELFVNAQPVLDVAHPVWILPQTESAEAFLLLGESAPKEKQRLGTLRIGLPSGGAMATAERISEQVFWIITLGSALVLIVGLVFVRRLLHPVHLLSRAAERIGSGHLGETLPVLSSDEMGDLTESFNRMSQDLARFRRLSASAMEGVVLLEGGRVIDANDAMARILGHEKAEDLIGVNGWLYIPRDARRYVIQKIRDNNQGYFETVLRQRDGTVIPVEVIGSRLPQKGRTVGVVAVRDIREQKKADEARRQLDRQLIQSERMASMGTTAAGIVHNLKNPLTGILGFSKLLREKYPGLQEVKTIEESALLMADMIENILAKSRQNKTSDWVNINQLLQRELDFLKADLTFKNEVETQIDLAWGVQPVWCVYTDLSQVFGNLLRNAVEAMYDCPVKNLYVSTIQAQDAVLVTIKDSGQGICKEHQENLFEPFFTTKLGDGITAPQGTGLGLYIVRQLLETYRGRIEVDSEVGAGTTFRVWIPVGERKKR